MSQRRTSPAAIGSSPRRIAFTTDWTQLGLHSGYFIGQMFNFRLAHKEKFRAHAVTV
jgi:hypothetical protein